MHVHPDHKFMAGHELIQTTAVAWGTLSLRTPFAPCHEDRPTGSVLHRCRCPAHHTGAQAVFIAPLVLRNGLFSNRTLKWTLSSITAWFCRTAVPCTIHKGLHVCWYHCR